MSGRVLFIAFSCMLSACGASDFGDPGTEKPRVALILKSLENEYFKTMQDNAVAHQKFQMEVFDLVTEGVWDEKDVSGQIALVDKMIAQEVNAIVIAPAHSQALVSVLKRAIDAGIVVVNIETRIDRDFLETQRMTIPFIGPDNRAGAKLAGDYLARSLNENDSVAIVGGIPDAMDAVQRRLGFEDAMGEAGARIVSYQAADWEMPKAHGIVSEFLKEHPDLKAVLCANDNMALGAMSAIRDAGKLDSIRIVGYDNTSAVRELVRDGVIVCTVDSHDDERAVRGIEFALEIITFGLTPEDRETSVDLITTESLGR